SARKSSDVWRAWTGSQGDTKVQSARTFVRRNRPPIQAISENCLMAFRFVAVGTSLGGFDALKTVLGALPEALPLPIGVVQHRSHADSEALAPLLANYTPMPVLDVDDKEMINQGHVYICPSNYHLLIDGNRFALSAGAPVLHARPSIDLFFES